MIFRAMTLRDMADAITAVVEIYDAVDEQTREQMVNPDAPVMVIHDELCFQIKSFGGEQEIEGFVLTVNSKPVARFMGNELKEF